MTTISDLRKFMQTTKTGGLFAVIGGAFLFESMSDRKARHGKHPFGVSDETDAAINTAGKVVSGFVVFEGLKRLGYSESMAVAMVAVGAAAFARRDARGPGHAAAGQLRAGWEPWRHEEWHHEHEHPWFGHEHEREHFRRW
jgi:hypothetical protein